MTFHRVEKYHSHSYFLVSLSIFVRNNSSSCCDGFRWLCRTFTLSLFKCLCAKICQCQRIVVFADFGQILNFISWINQCECSLKWTITQVPILLWCMGGVTIYVTNLMGLTDQPWTSFVRCQVPLIDFDISCYNYGTQ